MNSYLFKQHPLTILDGMHGDLYVFPQFLSDVHFCAYLTQKLEIVGLSTYRISPLTGVLKSMLHLVKSVPDLKHQKNTILFSKFNGSSIFCFKTVQELNFKSETHEMFSGRSNLYLFK